MLFKCSGNEDGVLKAMQFTFSQVVSKNTFKLICNCPDRMKSIDKKYKQKPDPLLCKNRVRNQCSVEGTWSKGNVLLQATVTNADASIISYRGATTERP